jgi:hypothetical protein
MTYALLKLKCNEILMYNRAAQQLRIRHIVDRLTKIESVLAGRDT